MEGNYSSNKRTFLKNGIIIALITLIVIFGILMFNNVIRGDGARVYLDINPSFTLEVNPRDKVTSIHTLDTEVKNFVDTMGYRNQDVKQVLEQLIGHMVIEGYLSEEENALLLTVEHEDSEKRQVLENKLSKVIEDTNTSNFNFALYTQKVEKEDEVEETTKETNLSHGKSLFIQNLVKTDDTFTVEELSDMSINDIALIIESKNIEPANVNHKGSVSKKKYITEEEALNIVYNHSKVNKATVKELEVEFDVEVGVVVYDIEFDSNNNEYSYYIDAISGKILKVHMDEDENLSKEEGKVLITREEAKKIALEDAKVKEVDLVEYQVELDHDHSSQEYEIDFETKEAEYEYVLDAVSGKVLDVDKEVKTNSNTGVINTTDKATTNSNSSNTNNNSNTTNTTSENVLSKDEIKSIVLKHSGVSNSNLVKFESEYGIEDGRKVYEVEFETREMEYDYLVDAITGGIISTEKESAHD